MFCTAKSNLDGFTSHRNPWVIAPATERKAKALGAAIGLAVGKEKQFNPSKTYCLLSEDSINEDGYSWEAARYGAACGMKLNRLFLIVSVTTTKNTVEIAKQFDAFKWYTQIIDGHDLEDLCSVFSTNDEGNSHFQWNLLRTFS